MSYLSNILALGENLDTVAGELAAQRERFQTDVRALFSAAVGDDTSDAPQSLQDAHVLLEQAIEEKFDELAAAVAQARDLLGEYAGALGSVGIG